MESWVSYLHLLPLLLPATNNRYCSTRLGGEKIAILFQFQRAAHMWREENKLAEFLQDARASDDVGLIISHRKHLRISSILLLWSSAMRRCLPSCIVRFGGTYRPVTRFHRDFANHRQLHNVEKNTIRNFNAVKASSCIRAAGIKVSKAGLMSTPYTLKCHVPVITHPGHVNTHHSTEALRTKNKCFADMHEITTQRKINVFSCDV
jgi:hypothetical protein